MLPSPPQPRFVAPSPLVQLHIAGWPKVEDLHWRRGKQFSRGKLPPPTEHEITSHGNRAFQREPRAPPGIIRTPDSPLADEFDGDGNACDRDPSSAKCRRAARQFP